MADDVLNVARAVHYEMSFLNHVSKSEVLSESAFKYPAVEWLERKGGKNEVLFEKGHPVFYKRRTDISWLEDKVWSYIEMKFVKGDTAGETEQQRYFDDLLRLIHILMRNAYALCYFLACGKTDNWMDCFQNLGIKSPKGKVPNQTYQDVNEKREKIVDGNYAKWFSFNSSDSVREIDTKNFPTLYDSFCNRYKFKDATEKHPERIVLFTKLHWISEVKGFQSPCSTALWQVELKEVQ